MKSALKTVLFVSCVMCIFILAACSSQKESVTSRGMQNLTARYNILYNAREILKESERNIALSYQDNYDVLISVYKEPNESLSQPELKKLDDVILKANTIVNDKSQSKYVDDAYFLIGKANFLKSNFYNATEFFTYVYTSYPKQAELRQAALAYKIRSLINSERWAEAESTLDTAFKYIETEKSSVADLHAIAAQMAIYRREDAKAVTLLEKAIEAADKGQKQIRWTFLLAQLQQSTGQLAPALQSYNKIIRSNAPFDMAFNARLQSLSIQDEQNGRQADRPTQLLSLLRNDNNLDFADQVYYEIARIYADSGKLDKAIENYNISIQKSTKNENQKGLSYLSLADIYFKQADYVKSKAYYDSTLTSLSPQHRDFELIRKKANSLELLANRLTTIAREDTLQMLARLPEAERDIRIGELVRKQAQKAISPQPGLPVSQGSFGLQQPALRNNGSEKFYFNNPIALSQGLTDFKRIWGNRKLEDNWRRSHRSSSDITSATINSNAGLGIPLNPDEGPVTNENLSATIINAVPLTPELVAASDQRILSAYYDIGNYYREVLNDEAEAIKTYETMLARFPDNDLKLPLYYNLYRLYAKSNPQKSAEYKNILVNQYPNSAFARIINNPDYNLQSDEQETALQAFYNKVYESYVQKDYPEVLKLTTEAKQSFAVNKLSPQLDYLQALALGHTQDINVLDSAFRQIVNNFPEDRLIVPLVQQHLRYIDSNRVAMSKRTYALVDFDPNEPRFVEEPEAEPAVQEDKGNVIALDPAVKAPVTAPPVTVDKPQPQVPTPIAAENSMFSANDSEEYYFVVNVTDPSVNLSSSRFGIGQFNRANFSGEGIKHQLKSVGNQNQLIFVGVFSSKAAAADYFKNINPLMKDIMKVPAEKYETFFISKENLDKLTDRDTINKYTEFYRTYITGANNQYE